jgi:hypothetical protein
LLVAVGSSVKARELPLRRACRETIGETSVLKFNQGKNVMPVLDNPRHEKFAQLIASGESAGVVYGKIYRSLPASAEASAARLLRNVKVRRRVAEIQAGAAARVGWSISERLAFLRRCAETPPSELSLSDPVCQGQRVGKDAEYLLVPDKLKAVDLYSKLAGDYGRDVDLEVPGVIVRIKIGGNVETSSPALKIP